MLIQVSIVREDYRTVMKHLGLVIMTIKARADTRRIMDIRDLDVSVSSHLTFLVGAKIIGNVLFAKSALLSFLLDALYPTTPMCFIELHY